MRSVVSKSKNNDAGTLSGSDARSPTNFIVIPLASGTRADTSAVNCLVRPSATVSRPSLTASLKTFAVYRALSLTEATWKGSSILPNSSSKYCVPDSCFAMAVYCSIWRITPMAASLEDIPSSVNSSSRFLPRPVNVCCIDGSTFACASIAAFMPAILSVTVRSRLAVRPVSLRLSASVSRERANRLILSAVADVPANNSEAAPFTCCRASAANALSCSAVFCVSAVASALPRRATS